MIEIDTNGYYKIECICLKDDFHFNNKIYKDKIYTCKGHINSDYYYYSVRSGDKYYGIFKKEIFKQNDCRKYRGSTARYLIKPTVEFRY